MIKCTWVSGERWRCEVARGRKEGFLLSSEKEQRWSDGFEEKRRRNGRISPSLIYVPRVCSAFSRVRCLFRRCFGNRVPDTPCEKRHVNRWYKRASLPRQARLEPGGLCTGRTCLSPQPKHLSVIDRLDRPIWEIPSSAYGE